MGHKIPLYEGRRTIVMASGNRLDLHNVTAFDCSGTFLRLWSEEGFTLINEKNIDWMIAKEEQRIADYPEAPEGYTYTGGDDPYEFDIQELFDQIKKEEIYSHLTDPEAWPEPPVYDGPEEQCDCEDCNPVEEDDSIDAVAYFLQKAAGAITAEEALMWTQAATNVENLNYMTANRPKSY